MCSAAASSRRWALTALSLAGHPEQPAPLRSWLSAQRDALVAQVDAARAGPAANDSKVAALLAEAAPLATDAGLTPMRHGGPRFLASTLHTDDSRAIRRLTFVAPTFRWPV
jgi:hypothetical protein